MNKILHIYKGRLNRSTFFLGWLVFLLFSIIVVAVALSITDGFSHFNPVISIVIAVLFAGLYFFFFSLAVRRFHDMGRSGWTCLLVLIPYINLLVLLYLFFMRGNKEKNKYGESLKQTFVVKRIFT